MKITDMTPARESALRRIARLVASDIRALHRDDIEPPYLVIVEWCDCGNVDGCDAAGSYCINGLCPPELIPFAIQFAEECFRERIVRKADGKYLYFISRQGIPVAEQSAIFAMSFSNWLFENFIKGGGPASDSAPD